MSPRLLTACAALFVTVATVVFAESGKAALPDAANANPTPSRLDEVLNRWGEAFADVRTCRLKYSRYEYDSVLLTEKRGQGVVRFEAPGRLLWTTEPQEPDDSATSHRVSGSGQPYELLTVARATWYVDHVSLLMINPDLKTYDVLEMPQHLRDVCRAPIDLLRDISAAPAYLRQPGFAIDLYQAKGLAFRLCDSTYRTGSLLCGCDLFRYLREFGWKIDRDTNEEIRLSGYPRTSEAAANLSRVEVILNPSTYRPTAVRYTDPGGNKSTVFVIHEMALNGSSQGVRPPRLEGYKRLN